MTAEPRLRRSSRSSPRSDRLRYGLPLARKLAQDYPEVGADAVLRCAQAAVAALDLFGAGRTRHDDDHDEVVEVAERIARHDLDVLSGRERDRARLDPERHPSRAPSADRRTAPPGRS